MLMTLAFCLSADVHAGMGRLGLDDSSAHSDLILHCSSTNQVVTILEVWKDATHRVKADDASLLEYARRRIPHMPHTSFVLFLKRRPENFQDADMPPSPWGVVGVVPVVGNKAKFLGPPIGKHLSTGKDKPIDYDFEEFRSLVRKFSSRNLSTAPNKAGATNAVSPQR